MVERGWLADYDRDDPVQVRDAISDIIDCWSRGTLTTGSVLTGQGD